jgi:hypothetical protein
MKLLSFRKIGTVLAIAVFGFISFTAGVDLTQNANSAASSSALPVAKGGTGANNGTDAVTNLGAQAKLVSGTNIKTIDGGSILGAGNINANKCNYRWFLIEPLSYYVLHNKFQAYETAQIAIFGRPGGIYLTSLTISNITNWTLVTEGNFHLASTMASMIDIGIVKEGKYAGNPVLYNYSSTTALQEYLIYCQQDSRLPSNYTLIKPTDADWDDVKVTFLPRYEVTTGGAVPAPQPTRTAAP